jgi:hypothetical protein
MTAPPDDLDLRLAVLEATLLERSTAQERALSVAMTASEKRLDTMNEWRATYADLVTNTMSRTGSAGLFAVGCRGVGAVWPGFWYMAAHRAEDRQRNHAVGFTGGAP